MSDFHRREFLSAAALAAFAPLVAKAAPARSPGGMWFDGHEVQGGLVLGHVDSTNETEIWVNDAPVRVADGMFCFGFGRDDTKPAIVKARYLGRYEETKEVSPKKRSFRVQRINGLPEQYVRPPKDVLDRIARDATAVREARSHDRDEEWFAEPFDWPAAGPITSIYGSQRVLNGKPSDPHYGVDIGSPAGTPIKAPADGVVTLAEDLYLSGNTAILDHGHGVSTSYLHMSKMLIKPGDRLERGQDIGLIGQTGRATGPHLCWRLNWFQTRLDVALVVASPRTGDKV